MNLTALLFFALTSTVAFGSSSAVQEGLDPKLEKPWGDSLDNENTTLKNLGRVIGEFVANEAKIHQAWREELTNLRKKKGLWPSERKRKNALERILGDLPPSEGLATRDVHRRAQACVSASLKIDPNLAAENQKGVFIPGAEYDAVVRFSNGNPKNLSDVTPDARGLAVKLLPQGAKHLSAVEQNEKGLLDILAINFPVFFVNDPVKYVQINQSFLRTTTDPVEAAGSTNFLAKIRDGFTIYLSGLLTDWERELLLDVNGSVILNPLYESYWSMMSYRLGDERDPERTAVKYIWQPCEQNLPEEGVPEWSKSHDYSKFTAQISPWSDIPSVLEYDRYYLRKNLLRELYANIVTKRCFKLQIQRYIDEENTPVEDTTQIWLENAAQRKIWAEKFAKHGGEAGRHGYKARRREEFMLSRKISEPVTIGTLEIDPVAREVYENAQLGKSTNTPDCENLSFDPWNNVPSAHKPLGIVGRMRKFAYAGSKHERHKMNYVKDNDK
jgi:hypothetical protein